MANLVVHFEIHASEPQKLIDFYSELLGWHFENYGGGEQPYWVIDTGEGAIGNAAGQPGLGINGGLIQRQGPRPEVGAPVVGATSWSASMTSTG
jgi:predicted enzyme related to lactoylglutathione lyase